MSNPYEVSELSQANSAKRPTSPFVVGARNGFLWSLLVAIPAAFSFYNEFTMSMGNPLDPATLTRTRIPLTTFRHIAACVQAAITAALWIVLPWASVAGFVKRAQSKQPGHAEVEP